MDKWDYTKSWFHGSPIILDVIVEGSTITQDRNLARIFSHKPSIVARDENGAIFHNGKNKGYLYIINETVHRSDIYPHPYTTMKPGEEWLIRKSLKVKKLENIEIRIEELLSEEEEKRLRSKLK